MTSHASVAALYGNMSKIIVSRVTKPIDDKIKHHAAIKNSQHFNCTETCR